MTLDERIRRARWCLDAIEQKAGASDRSRIEVAMHDAEVAAAELQAIWRELARRADRIGGGR